MNAHNAFIIRQDDDYTPATNAASSAEPFTRPDYKAKRHSRPKPAKPRANERIGAGFFVFKRHDDGRVHPSGYPFEHANANAARAEADRLADTMGGNYEIYERVGFGGGVDDEDWDRAPNGTFGGAA